MFSTTCYQKGCHQTMEPYLENNEVYCSSCDAIIPNITIFIKNQMKQNKQIKKKSSSDAFSIKCFSCGKDKQPILIKDDPSCPSCNKPHSNLSGHFKLMLKEKLKKISD